MLLAAGCGGASGGAPAATSGSGGVQYDASPPPSREEKIYKPEVYYPPPDPARDEVAGSLMEAAEAEAERLSERLGGDPCLVMNIDPADDGLHGTAEIMAPGQVTGASGKAATDETLTVTFTRNAPGEPFTAGEVRDAKGERFALSLQMLKR